LATTYRAIFSVLLRAMVAASAAIASGKLAA